MYPGFDEAWSAGRRPVYTYSFLHYSERQTYIDIYIQIEFKSVVGIENFGEVRMKFEKKSMRTIVRSHVCICARANTHAHVHTSLRFEDKSIFSYSVMYKNVCPETFVSENRMKGFREKENAARKPEREKK